MYIFRYILIIALTILFSECDKYACVFVDLCRSTKPFNLTLVLEPLEEFFRRVHCTILELVSGQQ